MWTRFHDMHSGGGEKEEGKPHIFPEERIAEVPEQGYVWMW